MSESTTIPRADRWRFSLHPEEDVTETPPHRRQIEYLHTNLRTELPHLFVGANMGVYWVEGQYEEPWAGPDILVSQQTPARLPERVYLVWEDGPLRFVGEVASRRTRRQEPSKREQIYRVDLQVSEYLYIDLERHQLDLWRLRDGQYERVPSESERLYSEQLGVWFGWEEGREFVRVWTADGRMLPTWEEIHEQALAAETRAAELAAELERLRQERRVRDADALS